LNLGLIFFFGKGAGGIDQPAAGFEQSNGRLQDTLLSLGAVLDLILGKSVCVSLAPTDQHLATARGIDQHRVERLWDQSR